MSSRELHASPFDLSASLSASQVRERLSDAIETFIVEKIQLADQAIIAYAASRIAPGDVVLVFASSYTVEQVRPASTTFPRLRARSLSFPHLRRLWSSRCCCIP